MNEITVINKSEILGQTISVYGTPEEPLFLARDVAEWIEYNPDDINKLIGIVDDGEKLTRTIFWSGQNREMWFLTEDGLYEILMQSRKPKAKIFKGEVKKILKTIRRHGAYLTPAKLEEALLNPDVLIQLATNLKTEREKSARLEARIKADSAKVRFAEAVTASSATIRIGELAKILKQNGYATGQTRLFAQLRAEGYLMKNAVGENIPTQKAMELGLFEIQESAIVTNSGKEFITKTTRVTGKGQQYFIDRYAKPQPAQGGIA